MDLIITILPVVTKDFPISPRFTPYNFLSRCKFSTFTTRQPMVKFYLLTFPRFQLQKKEHKSYFGKNRTHDFRSSRCAGYLDHSGDKYTVQFFLFIFFLRTSSAQGGGGVRCQTFSFSFFPCSADHERDWPPCKVVFFGLATNALNVRNNNNNNIINCHARVSHKHRTHGKLGLQLSLLNYI